MDNSHTDEYVSHMETTLAEPSNTERLIAEYEDGVRAVGTGEAVFWPDEYVSELVAALLDAEAARAADAEQVTRLMDEESRWRGRAEYHSSREDVLAQRLDSLDELFLHMPDRVAGYMSTPPVARFFHNGAAAFEWAATNVRRARDGEPLLDPPVPGLKVSTGDVQESTESELAANPESHDNG